MRLTISIEFERSRKPEPDLGVVDEKPAAHIERSEAESPAELRQQPLGFRA